MPSKNTASDVDADASPVTTADGDNFPPISGHPALKGHPVPDRAGDAVTVVAAAAAAEGAAEISRQTEEDPQADRKPNESRPRQRPFVRPGQWRSHDGGGWSLRGPYLCDRGAPLPSVYCGQIHLTNRRTVNVID